MNPGQLTMYGFLWCPWPLWLPIPLDFLGFTYCLAVDLYICFYRLLGKVSLMAAWLGNDRKHSRVSEIILYKIKF